MYPNILPHDEACQAMPIVQECPLGGDANTSQEHGTRKPANPATDAKGLCTRYGVGAAEEARYRRQVALYINDQAAAQHWGKVGEAVRTQRFGS
jgi:hypothetical protein